MILDCWVGSLDFNFFAKSSWVFHQSPQKLFTLCRGVVAATKDRALSEWDPARQAAQACTHLRDLAEERCRLRPVEELVNTSSNLPFVHKDSKK